jgi:hypothetical protein
LHRCLALGVLLVALAGCGSGNSSPPPTLTPTAVKVAVIPTSTTAPAPTATATVSPAYRSFLNSICAAFGRSDAGAIINSLMYYQYNSGLRYGTLGDGEGQTGDPSLMRTWLSGRRVQCRYFTPDSAGHGTVLTAGWQSPGRWSLIELDTVQGHWKINDFTFGNQGSLFRAMRVAGIILPYHG